MSEAQVLKALSRVLSYPDEQTLEAAEMLYVMLQNEHVEAAKDMADFGAFVERHELSEVEEAYTRIFDINTRCALEVGWHLFGEEYARGMFLVRMREELRNYGLQESTELPDHITHVLAVLAAMPPHEAERFAKACVLPAVRTMHQAIQKQDTPYQKPISCLNHVLNYLWSAGGPGTSEPLIPSPSTRKGVDLLHAYPVADVRFDCGSCGGDHPPRELVSLQVDANQNGSALS
jgi:nitrate reductase delta subunit